MIHYDLCCDRGHSFDGWFKDSAAYDAQVAQGLVSCSHCGSTAIVKQLMSPGLAVQSKLGIAQSDMLQKLREFRKTVEAQSDYVGPRFAEEARRLHYAESKGRGIYGETSREEAKSLLEEGIEIFPLPILPEEQN